MSIDVSPTIEYLILINNIFKIRSTKPNKITKNIIMDKLKELAVMRFIYNALQDGYSVQKNDDGTYSFTISTSKDVNLTTFIKNCMK